MERLQIHNKSYVVRWLSVPDQYRLKWSICPQKQSINIAIIRRPDEVPQEKITAPDLNSSDPVRSRAPKPATQNEKTTARESLESKGMKMVQWVGKCEAEKVTEGYLDVEDPGAYGFVFDNTFSKQNSKIVIACLSVEPQNTNLGATFDSDLNPWTESQSAAAMRPISRQVDPSGKPNNSSGSLITPSPVAFSGILLKKRRKKNQGYARRLFSLDYPTSTLFYYKNAQSSAFRGAIPLALAVVSTDRDSGIIVIDSGVEVWHLKATNPEDYQNWQGALQKALANAESAFTNKNGRKAPSIHRNSRYYAFNDWAHLEALVSKLSNIQEVIKKLARNTDPNDQNAQSSNEVARGQDFRAPDQSNYLKVPPHQTVRRSGPKSASSTSSTSSHSEESIHENALSIYESVHRIVADFHLFISKRGHQSSSAASLSDGDDEFFDAEEGVAHHSAILSFTYDAEGENASVIINDDDSDDEGIGADMIGPGRDRIVTKAVGWNPLPNTPPVNRRTTIQAPTVEPPSIVSMMKNVGTSMGSASAPVTANEPLSTLQRFVEQFEYVTLLNEASTKSNDLGERILYIAAFAISYMSSSRSKPRVKRKPFNPLLGETFELVREDLGYRVLAEKVAHNPLPLGLAIHAQSPSWTVVQSPKPDQKFWGRSATITTEGPVHIFLHDTGEHYCYSMGLTYLKNLLAGERYVEPAETMTIHNLTNSQTAVISFQVTGVFSSRGESVTVAAFDGDKKALPLKLEGKWNQELRLKGGSNPRNGTSIWSVNGEIEGDKAPPYGLTSFAASLNEITTIEKGHLAPTDSRLRPDQRLLENGDYENAGYVKEKLEQRQRERRNAGQKFTPRWFVEIDNVGGQEKGEALYQLKTGPEGYWEQRKTGNFTSCLPIFEIE